MRWGGALGVAAILASSLFLTGYLIAPDVFPPPPAPEVEPPAWLGNEERVAAAPASDLGLDDDLDQATQRMIEQLQEDRAALRREAVAVEGRLQAAHREAASERARVDQFLAREASLWRESRDLRARLDSAERNLRDARIMLDTARETQALVSERRWEAEDGTADLRRQIEEARRDARERQAILSWLREIGASPLAIQQVVPAIHGEVVVVRAVPEDPAHPLVLLSVGEEDRVEQHFQFTLHRGDEFVGRVQVVRVLRDMSGARVLFTRDEATSIQPGDEASTRIE